MIYIIKYKVDIVSVYNLVIILIELLKAMLKTIMFL